MEKQKENKYVKLTQKNYNWLRKYGNFGWENQTSQFGVGSAYVVVKIKAPALQNNTQKASLSGLAFCLNHRLSIPLTVYKNIQ